MKTKEIVKTAICAAVYGAIVARIVTYWNAAGAGVFSIVAGCLYFGAICFAIWYLITKAKW